jgi:predicted RNase H-like nuclease (RuvC/YqgF family)
VEDELPIDDSTMDYKTFFNNADKIFEIYNICAEEMCGQLVLLDLTDHSKMFKKLYHHFKQQLYNIMKFQLVIQKELNDQYEAERRSRQEMEKLEIKLRESQEKIRSLEINLNEQSRKNKSLMNNLNFYKNQYIKDPNQVSGFKNDVKGKSSKKNNSLGKNKINDENINKPKKKGSLNFEDSLEDNITGSEEISSLIEKSEEIKNTPKYTLFDVEDEEDDQNGEDGKEGLKLI